MAGRASSKHGAGRGGATAAGGAVAAPTVFEVPDEETGEISALNQWVFGTKKVEVVEEKLHSAAGGDPKLGRALRFHDAHELKLEQERDLADYVAREAQREEVRKALLASEVPGWRKSLMKTCFLEDRLAAAKGLQQLKLEQEVLMTKYLRAKGFLR